MPTRLTSNSADRRRCFSDASGKPPRKGRNRCIRAHRCTRARLRPRESPRRLPDISEDNSCNTRRSMLDKCRDPAPRSPSTRLRWAAPEEPPSDTRARTVYPHTRCKACDQQHSKMEYPPQAQLRRQASESRQADMRGCTHRNAYTPARTRPPGARLADAAHVEETGPPPHPTPTPPRRPSNEAHDPSPRSALPYGSRTAAHPSTCRLPVPSPSTPTRPPCGSARHLPTLAPQPKHRFGPRIQAPRRLPMRHDRNIRAVPVAAAPTNQYPRPTDPPLFDERAACVTSEKTPVL